MACAIGKTYTNERIILDGNTYDRCVFRRCAMRFSAQDDIALHDCEYDHCTWEFSGPALLTVLFLRTLDATEGGHHVVERALGRPSPLALTPPGRN